MRIAEPDSNPIYVGRPGKRKGFGGNRRNSLGAEGGDSHGQLLGVSLCGLRVLIERSFSLL